MSAARRQNAPSGATVTLSITGITGLNPENTVPTAMTGKRPTASSTSASRSVSFAQISSGSSMAGSASSP